MKDLTREESARSKAPESRSVMISVYGSDHLGIVSSVSGLLAERKINITDLNTRVVGSKDQPVYVMVMEGDLPDKLLIEELERDLRALSGELKVDITLNPIETAHL